MELLGKTLTSATTGISYTFKSIVGKGSEGVVYRARASRPSAPNGSRRRATRMQLEEEEGHLSASVTLPSISTLTTPKAVGSVAIKVRSKNTKTVSDAGGWTEEDFLTALPPHPCVMTPIDSFDTPTGQPCLVFPLASDSLINPLNALHKKGHGEIERIAFSLFHQLVSGVLHIHSHGVAHRDIKCENLLILEEGVDGCPRLAVTDFGLAKFADRVPLARAGVGSPHYVAPEVVHHGSSSEPSEHPAYDPCAADVWSCGVTLHCLMFGRLPYSEMDGDRVLRLANAGKFSFRSEPTSALSNLLKAMLAPALSRISMEGVMEHPFWLQSCNKFGLDPEGVRQDSVADALPALGLNSPNGFSLSDSPDSTPQAQDYSPRPTTSDASPHRRLKKLSRLLSRGANKAARAFAPGDAVRHF